MEVRKWARKRLEINEKERIVTVNRLRKIVQDRRRSR